MAVAPTLPVSARFGLSRDPWQRHPFQSIWRAPLVPVALALTAGIVMDRHFDLPIAVSLLAAFAALLALVAASAGRQTGLAVVYLCVMVAALGAAYHQWHRHVFAEDDLGEFVQDDPRPTRLRGVIAEEPTVSLQPDHGGLQSFRRPDPTVAVIEVARLHDRRDWITVSGRARLVVTGSLTDIHVGDEVEVVGRLIKPQPPANPGEFDYASYLLDQRIRAIVQVGKTPDGVTRLAKGWSWSVPRALPLLRGWGQQTLEDALPARYAGLAVALLLGEGSLMTGQDWDKYIRTGVIHVLAISGQHLVVLAAFLWGALRLLGVRRRRGAFSVGIFLLGYSLLTGGRPPVMRSAVSVCALCLGLILRRPVMMANTFALAWIVVALLNPTDLFGSGCQLSFLAVAVLYWGTNSWTRPKPDPLERLVDEGRPLWVRGLRTLGGTVLLSYLVTLAIWLAAAPLVAGRYHLLSPIGIVLGPPLVLLTSIALLTGFLLLLFSICFTPLVPVLAWITTGSLAACEFLVDWGLTWPAAYFYMPDIPDWWLWIFYLSLLAALMLEPLRRRWRWTLAAGLAWICVGLVAGAALPAPDEFRCTFLAVGHGGCTILETPDGRTLLYDAGAIGGPDVTRRQIAPYLWNRGIRRIDEVLLSHADLDHFNGLLEVFERFTVGQVTCRPTFANKSTEAVRLTLAAIRERGIPLRIVRAGDRLSAGPVSLEVIHPPAVGPEGNENSRSMVLLVRHAGHSVLLTGDLERTGMDRVLELPRFTVDILMAPHHGSRSTDTPGLAAKVRPRMLVACQGPPRGATRPPDPNRIPGILYWGTWPHGAVTVRSRAGRLVVETFLTGQRLVFDTAQRDERKQ
jgi:competence protein ComEC